MKKNIYWLSSIVLSLVVAAACSHSDSKNLSSGKGEHSGNWQERMQALSKVLSDLLPLVANEAKFSDPKNSMRIDQDTKALKTLAHSLNSDSLPANSDPSLRITADLFEEDINRALTSLQAGRTENARLVLRDTTAYCIQCHTQTNNGPNFPRLNLSVNLQDLSLLERAEFYTATRQFDHALEAFYKVIDDKAFAKTHPFEWEQAARSAIAITIKVEKDPDKLIKLVQKIEENNSTPIFVQKSVRPWIAAAREWKREPHALLRSPSEMLKSASRIISKAQKQQAFPLDHSQDILYFRASAVLHDLLAIHNVKDELSAEALYFSGITAEATRDLNFWTLHETYYEMCIRRAPRTELARKCYQRLNDSVLLGYSGSSGTTIPPEVQNNLNELKKLLPGAGIATPVATPAASSTPAPTAPSPGPAPLAPAK
jgi:hypothetical protein